MAEPLSAHIMRLMPQAMHMYHRLVLVVAPLGAGKTAALREVAQQTGYNYINVNLELRGYPKTFFILLQRDQAASLR